MDKTYISALMVVLMAGARMAQAQESLDDVFAQLDAANGEGAAVAETDAAKEKSKLEDLYEQGLANLKARKFDEATKAFEAMLAIDKYNKKASAALRRTAAYVASFERSNAKTTRDTAISQVEQNWNEPAKNLYVEPETKDPKETEAEKAIAAMKARMQSIIIPKLDFRDANIEDVVMFLTEASIRFDAEKKGVNLVVQGLDTLDDTGAITISIRDMDLLEALKFITEMGNLKFSVGEKVVSIMPMNYADGVVVTKSFDINAEVGMVLGDFSPEGEGGGMEDIFGGGGMDSGGGSSPVDVTEFFGIVDFPEGTEAVYQPRFSKLFVKNTKERIQEVEDILFDLTVKADLKRSQQVNIKAKFVEFNEGALEELGFDWTILGSGDVGGVSLGAPNSSPVTGLVDSEGSTIDLADGNKAYLQSAQAGSVLSEGMNLFGMGMRSGATAFAASESGVLAGMGGIAPVFNLAHKDFNVAIKAMQQDGTADILSVPEVTTKSGNEAILRVVEVHRFPQDYDVETGQRTAPVVKPQDWEEEDLGVVLKVTPVVDAEANTIDLDVLPTIKEFRGYDEYIAGYNSYETGGSESNPVMRGDGSALVVRMPYFEMREVQTQVTVADGSTIAMGGLVSETTETFVDRVPFIGDIPYVGRLFRSEGSRSSKRNLVIFVTATQVDDKGMTRDDRDEARQAQQASIN